MRICRAPSSVNKYGQPEKQDRSPCSGFTRYNSLKWYGIRTLRNLCFVAEIDRSLLD